MHHGKGFSFLKGLINVPLLVNVTSSVSGQNVPHTSPSLNEISIDQLQDLLQNGVITSVDLVRAYLSRTYEVNEVFNAVSELNPDALAIAAALDAERAAGKVRGPLHGIPISIKDNIATLDRMDTTAGSYALLGARVSREATVAIKLREAGAILLHKAAMGEWAQMRSSRKSSSPGWSAMGGQVYGAYHPRQDPHGSSSGSAVVVAVGLAPASIGTETSGSIVNPAEKNNQVGLKPTLGLTSRNMVIPISVRQDTVGPLTQTVKDAAIVLSAIAGRDDLDKYGWKMPFDQVPDYTRSCVVNGLENARIGIAGRAIKFFVEQDPTMAPIISFFNTAIKDIINAGACVLEQTDFHTWRFEEFCRNSSIVLDTDFESGLEDYLAQLSYNPHNIQNLAELAAFTRAHPLEEYPNRDTYVWDRILERTITSESPESIQAYKENERMAKEEGIDGVLDKYNLDALIMPTFAAFHLPAVDGHPVITVPLGFFPDDTPLASDLKETMTTVGPGIPFGISFIGRKWSEETLIRLAYAYEQMTMHRRKRKPILLPTTELKNVKDTYLEQENVAESGAFASEMRSAVVNAPLSFAVANIENQIGKVRRWIGYLLPDVAPDT